MSQNEVNNEELKEETFEETAEEVTEDVAEDTISEEVEVSEEPQEPSDKEIIEQLKGKLEKAKNDFARAYADTDNMRKRLQKEADSAKKYRFQQAGLELLPILDSMALALNVQTDNEEVLNYVKGFEMIQTKLIQVMEREGVVEIDALNKPFDHNTMQALMQEEVEGVEPGIVVEVLQKGYMLKDRILRPALVKVSA